jgi:hypothetical protein
MYMLCCATLGAYSVRVPNLSSFGASKAALARWSELISADIPELPKVLLLTPPTFNLRFRDQMLLLTDQEENY